jgi:hypothetical protein
VATGDLQLRQETRARRGFVLLTVAVIAVVMIGFMGLVVDVGLMRYWKRKAQNAADAGAVSGIQDVNSFGSNADHHTAVLQEAETHGFVNGQGGVTIQSNRPPSSGPFTGNPRYVEVIVSKTLPTTFMSILNVSAATVRARAVASSRLSDACIIALRPDGDGRFEAGGSSIFTTACGIWVNSNGNKAFRNIASACVSASSIRVVGQAEVNTSCPGSPTPAPTTGVMPVTDPFASKPVPFVGPCNHSGLKVANTTLNPGVYCDGIEITGGTVTLNPGLYILDGNGLKIASNTVLIGNGVTFFHTSKSKGYGANTLNGTATIQLKAPTSGPYEAMLFWTDPALTNNNINKILGNSNSWLEGTLYFPKQQVEFTGTADLAGYTILVAYQIKITGNAEFHNNYSMLENGSPLKTDGGTVAE